jgi:3-hydroxyisobutyrate dehydrogenase-like beta-hydroxyacid dehydrogenase
LKKTVSVIGLGRMGYPIARNLISNGYTVYSNNHKKVKYRDNIKILNFKKDIFEKSDVIFLCLSNSKQIKKFLFEKNNLINLKKKPKFIIDLGTSDPQVTKYIYKKLTKLKIRYIDSPMGRNPDAAFKGKLNLMMGCGKNDIEDIRPLLFTIAENIFFMNKIGDGHKVKLINNYFGQSITILFLEILKILKINKIKAESFIKVIEAGPLYSQILNSIFNLNYKKDKTQMAFSITNAHKDLLYFQKFFKKNLETNILSEVLKILASNIKNKKGSISVGNSIKL